MSSPFPGMDPSFEHLMLWREFHVRLVVAIANHLQPRLNPRYVASVEERVYIEGPQRRIPDVWIQRTRDVAGEQAVAVAEPQAPGMVVVEVEDLEIHESRVEILDAYNDMRLVTLIEVISPTNKWAGPGRESYVQKQHEILARECHLVEIDLLRRGQHVASVPEWRLRDVSPFDYLACVNRWPRRNRYELFPMRLREPLAEVQIPLTAPDPDVPLPLQEVIEQVYEDGRYYRRVRYEDPCEPPLADDEQAWARECWNTFRNSHPEHFPA